MSHEREVSADVDDTVGDVMPMAAPVAEALASDRVRGFSGVLRGTANYVLSRVLQDELTVDEALEAARDCGYFDGDPTGELDGSSTARKAAMLSSLVFGVSVRPDDVYMRGIQELSAADLAAAKRLGFATKLVVTAKQQSGFLNVGVEPHVIPLSHPFSRLDGTTSMLIVDTGRKDRLVFWGPGAERQMADAASANIRDAMRRHPSLGQAQVSNIEGVLRVRDSPGRFLLRCQAISSEANDAIWGCLFSHGIGLDHASSVESLLENEVVVVTDLADRASIERALVTLEQDDIVCMSAVRVFECAAQAPPDR